MRCDRKTMLLYAVTDRAWLGNETLYMQVEKALKGGVTCVQLREKELCDEEFLKEAIELKKLCSEYNVPFIINDNVDIAVKCGADGVHVGQSDMNAKAVRQMIGEKMILGVSAQTAEQARLAVENGADYLGVGAVFFTSTKADAEDVSYDTLKEICQSVSVPIVAIGGICEDNIMQLSGSGIDGVALVSAIFASSDIEGSCKRLYKLSKEAFGNED
ncbi:MAG: thiamine phosphate synthase [Clostridia bacterium]|nr:thiamine phosphate synthase [Clostridia bacterium]